MNGPEDEVEQSPSSRGADDVGLLGHHPESSPEPVHTWWKQARTFNTFTQRPRSCHLIQSCEEEGGVRDDLPTTPRTHCLKTRVKSMRTANLDPSMLTCQYRHERSDRNTAGRPCGVQHHCTNTQLITGPPSTGDGRGWRLGSSAGALVG